MGQGAAGEMGRTGSTGPAGPAGPKGDKGDKGDNATIIWGALTDAQKTEIKNGLKAFAELKGPEGPAGPAGPAGDPLKVAEEISNNSGFITKLGQNIASQSTDLGKNVAKQINENSTYTQNIAAEMSKQKSLQDSVANELSTNTTYKERIRGQPGDIGNIDALKDALFTKSRTMWCADGDFCEVPESKKGIVINKSNFIQFGGGYTKEANAGRITYGAFDGGENGSLNIVGGGKDGQVRRVRVWDALQIGGWTIQEEGDQLVFKRGNAGTNDNEPNIRMASDGNLWVSRASGRGWVADGIGDLKNNVIRKDLNYYIQAQNGKCLDSGGVNHDCEPHLPQRRFQFVRLVGVGPDMTKPKYGTN